MFRNGYISGSKSEHTGTHQALFMASLDTQQSGSIAAGRLRKDGPRPASLVYCEPTSSTSDHTPGTTAWQCRPSLVCPFNGWVAAVLADKVTLARMQRRADTAETTSRCPNGHLRLDMPV
jgi:hypothetical protein